MEIRTRSRGILQKRKGLRMRRMKKEPRLGGEQSKGHEPLTKQNTDEKNEGEHFPGNVALKE